jgi:hypothetical protein
MILLFQPLIQEQNNQLEGKLDTRKGGGRQAPLLIEEGKGETVMVVLVGDNREFLSGSCSQANCVCVHGSVGWE